MTTLKDFDLDVRIIDGPSRETMFDSLRLADENRKVNFTFIVRDNRHHLKFIDFTKKESNSASEELITLIQGIERVSTQGKEWLVKIQFTLSFYEVDRDNRTSRFYYSSVTTNIIYNTDRRAGKITDRDFVRKVMRFNERSDKIDPGGLWFNRKITRNP